MSREGARLLVKAAYVFQPRLTADRVYEMHASSASEHEDALDASRMKKTEDVIRKLDHETSAHSPSV
jgi:hypothetical protein